MLRLTLAQMRLAAGRLTAAGTAVVLGTAFVAATLLGNNLMKQTIHNAVSASYAGADVVIHQVDTASYPDGDIPDPPIEPQRAAKLLGAMRSMPGADGADVKLSFGGDLVAGDRATSATIGALPTTPALRAERTASGSLPKAGELAVSAPTAERLHVAVGDTITVRLQSWAENTGRPVEHLHPLRISGILAEGAGFGLAPDAVAAADLTGWLREAGLDVSPDMIMVHAAPGVDPDVLRDGISANLRALGPFSARTRAEQADRETRRLTEGVDVLAGVLLGFAAIALFVAAMVIANTFQVLVAQRTRALALLRCVGATRRQIRRGVMLEAALLGLAASAVGVGLGIGLISATAAVLSRMGLSIAISSVARPDALSLVVPVLVGLTVTWLASLGPARAATRVSPVAALRPAMPAALRSRASVVRLVLSGLMIAGGGALLVLGPAQSIREQSTSGVLPALAGGALSFLGLLLAARLFVPRLIGLAGRLLGRWGGVPAGLAAANAVRNPRRTATTSAALLIGVTLVATMTTGAAVARATLQQALDTRFPVDIAVGTQVPEAGASGMPATKLTTEVNRKVTGVAGVTSAAALRGGSAEVSLVRGVRHTQGSDSLPLPVSVSGVDRATAARVVQDGAQLAPLAPGVAVVPARAAELLGIATDDVIRLQDHGHSIDVRVAVTDLHWPGIILDPRDQERLLPGAQVTMIWLRVAPGADARAVVENVADALVATGSEGAVDVAGPVAERAVFEQAISTMLMIVTGLLAVAVVIAVIGVANTLSLSVIERTRESAILRSLGLTRRQLRAMLAVEGALIAGIGALAGIALGLVYGWTGVASVLGGAWRPVVTAPVGQLSLLLVGGVTAGVVASALPGRRAAKVSPVAALGE